MAKEAEFFDFPNVLKAKVTLGPDGVDPAMIARAEAMIASMQGDYLSWAQEDLCKLQELLDQADAQPEAERLSVLKAIFNVSHDIKGQGGSFGYPLMTAIGNQLCRFIETHNSFGAAEMLVVRFHADAMRSVIGEHLEGDGGAKGITLTAGLNQLIQKLG